MLADPWTVFMIGIALPVVVGEAILGQWWLDRRLKRLGERLVQVIERRTR